MSVSTSAKNNVHSIGRAEKLKDPRQVQVVLDAQTEAIQALAAALDLVAAAGTNVGGVDLLAGAAAGAHTVAGMSADATIAQVWRVVPDDSHVDLTAEFSVTGANTIDNTGGTATIGDQLAVFWFEPSGVGSSGNAAAIAAILTD